MKYIQQNDQPPGCIFCLAALQENDAENLVIARGQYSYVILNRYPYTSGHLMVVPFLHKASIEELEPPIRQEMIELINRAIVVLRKVYQPDAFNFGANIGAAAGAGIADHVHMHLVARWNGDTNFMSTIGQTRVLPEDLQESYRRIHEVWA